MAATGAAKDSSGKKSNWTGNSLGSIRSKKLDPTRDKNTSNFETMATIRNRRSSTQKIKDEQDNYFEDQEWISQIARKEFTSKEN